MQDSYRGNSARNPKQSNANEGTSKTAEATTKLPTHSSNNITSSKDYIELRENISSLNKRAAAIGIKPTEEMPTNFRRSMIPGHFEPITSSYQQQDSVSENSPLLSKSSGEQQSEDHVVTHHRLIDRNGKCHQSGGRLNIKKRIKLHDWWNLYGLDWFHSLVNAPTIRVVLIIMSLYLSVIFIFAFVYYQIFKKYSCGLDFRTFVGAFDFALETMAAIGYSTSDIYFGDCIIMATVLSIHMCCKLVIDAFTIGIIYCRLARPHSRASTVLFSNKAIIRRIRGKLYFMFQLCELRKHQLVEAHVRVYVVKKEVDPYCDLPNHQYIQTCSMRLNHPNDELGGMLLLMMPQVIVHEIDLTSPLMPSPVWYSNINRSLVNWNPPAYRNYKRKGHIDGDSFPIAPAATQSKSGSDSRDEIDSYAALYDVEELSNLEFPNVHRRGSDVASGKDYAASLINPSSRASLLSLLSPIRDTPQIKSPEPKQRQSRTYKDDDIENQVSYNSPGLDRYKRDVNAAVVGQARNNTNPYQQSIEEPKWQLEEREMIQKYLEDRQMEIIVVVEGTDSATGGNVQARHSYIYKEIEWNKTFQYCLYPDPKDNITTVDFDAFHVLVDAPLDAAYPGPIPSSI